MRTTRTRRQTRRPDYVYDYNEEDEVGYFPAYQPPFRLNKMLTPYLANHS